MNREEQISSRQMVLTSALFWTLEGLLVTSAIINAVDGYTRFKENYPFGLQITGFAFSTTVSFISMGVIIDAFRRLSKCLEQDTLGISRKQIVIHLGCFFLATFSLVYCYSSCIILLESIKKKQNDNYELLIEYLVLSIGIAVVLVSVSTLPALLIFNSLMDQMITANLEATIIDDDFDKSSSSESESAIEGLLNEEEPVRSRSVVVP